MLDAIFSIVGKVVDSVFPNPEDKLKAQALQLQLQQALLASQTQLEQAAADNVKTEAASSNWLASSWRPITMLVFLCLIVSRVFGLTSKDITPDEYNHLWSLMEIGLGGYTIGRSVEKIAGPIADAIKR